MQKQLRCKILLYTLLSMSACCLFDVLDLSCAKQQLYRFNCYKFEHNLFSNKGLKAICFQW